MLMRRNRAGLTTKACVPAQSRRAEGLKGQIGGDGPTVRDTRAEAPIKLRVLSRDGASGARPLLASLRCFVCTITSPPRISSRNMASQGPIYSIGYLAIVEDPVPASQRASVATPFNVRELPRTVYPESVATLSSTTSATTSAGTTPAEENSAEEPKPPPRVYPLYSWRTQAPNTRLVYIRDLQTAETEVARLKPGPLGFDLEWKPNWQKGQQENPVALVQLASEDTVLLIQVSAIRGTMFLHPLCV